MQATLILAVLAGCLIGCSEKGNQSESSDGPTAFDWMKIETYEGHYESIRKNGQYTTIILNKQLEGETYVISKHTMVKWKGDDFIELKVGSEAGPAGTNQRSDIDIKGISVHSVKMAEQGNTIAGIGLNSESLLSDIPCAPFIGIAAQLYPDFTLKECRLGYGTEKGKSWLTTECIPITLVSRKVSNSQEVITCHASKGGTASNNKQYREWYNVVWSKEGGPIDVDTVLHDQYENAYQNHVQAVKHSQIEQAEYSLLYKGQSMYEIHPLASRID